MTRLALGLLWLLLVACPRDAASRTQLIAVADTDVAGVSRIAISVTSPMGRIEEVEGVAGAGPRTLTLVHETGPLGPFVVRAVGYRDSAEVVSREAVTSFVAGQSRIVPLFLSRRCADVRCAGEGRTCIDGACASSSVSPQDLPVWRGGDPSDALPARDDAGAGTMDAETMRDGSMPAPPDAGGPRDASTDAGDRDAGAILEVDGSTPGEMGMRMCGDAGVVDVSSNLAHCGGCDNACAIANAGQHFVTRCVRGTCEYRCQVRWGNCDGRPGNGCETDLATDETHCGGCEQACGADETCRIGRCN